MNYPGFKKLLDDYQHLGFQLLAFPSNQFGAQAPACDECERAYMYLKMGVKADAFPVFDKVDVNGPDSLTTFAILKDKAKGTDHAGSDIAWNYEKFLVDGDGKPLERYSSGQSPLVAEKAIRKLLGLSD